MLINDTTAALLSQSLQSYATAGGGGGGEEDDGRKGRRGATEDSGDQSAGIRKTGHRRRQQSRDSVINAPLPHTLSFPLMLS